MRCDHLMGFGKVGTNSPDRGIKKTIIVEGSRIIFPKVILDLTTIMPEDRFLLFRSLKHRAKLEKFEVIDIRGCQEGDYDIY